MAGNRLLFRFYVDADERAALYQDLERLQGRKRTQRLCELASYGALLERLLTAGHVSPSDGSVKPVTLDALAKGVLAGSAASTTAFAEPAAPTARTSSVQMPDIETFLQWDDS